MALYAYDTANALLTINGRIITDFGQTNPPIQHRPIDPKNTLRRGLGGNAIALRRENNGREMDVYLNPGSPDSAFVQGLLTSNAVITVSFAQVGTLEGFIASEGIVINDGEVGRGGDTEAGVTDDQYTFQFNVFSQTKGGD